MCQSDLGASLLGTRNLTWLFASALCGFEGQQYRVGAVHLPGGPVLLRLRLAPK